MAVEFMVFFFFFLSVMVSRNMTIQLNPLLNCSRFQSSPKDTQQMQI